ncbi:MAG: Hpt domain-containing protein [Gammaproteobacteria bacterium]|nr:Hpt domain-containing protein [Gammaproteobacteria bacterium]MBU0891139.1 Hpt domain-containing protein [Gammaproteobacteria bacterium]
MDAFLTKPLDPALLIRTVHAQVTRARGAPVIPSIAKPPSHAEPSTDWPEIEGIHTEGAKRLMMGDVGLLANLLQRFARDYDGGIPSLAESEGIEQRDALTARVHKLRGSSGMLGATRVHAIASQLEAALRGGAPEAGDMITALNEALQQVIAAAAATFPSAAPRPTAPRPASAAAPAPVALPASTLQAIEALRHLLEQQDLAAIQNFENLAPDLLALMGAQMLAPLSQAVHALDFASAARMLSDFFPKAS